MWDWIIPGAVERIRPNSYAESGPIVDTASEWTDKTY